MGILAVARLRSATNIQENTSPQGWPRSPKPFMAKLAYMGATSAPMTTTIYERLRMKQNVPPKPETIFAGLSSRRLAVEPEPKLGNNAPMPTAMPHNAKLMTTTVDANSNVSPPGIWSIQLEVSMRTSVIAEVQTLLSQNFSNSTRLSP